MSAAIRIENLGKKYTITRQRQGGSSYVSLRDVLSDGTKRMVQKILHPRGERGEEGASGTQEFWALKDINLEVEQGDKLAIIGHNGAGKSTLLKVLSRITEPTTGRITLHGRIASLLEVGTGFHPELTGRENIFLNGSILGMSQREIKRKFDEIVDFSGVETFLDTPVKRYSSGMRMRLGFAVAAHLDSEILVIDEVLAVGDAEFQKKCLGKMNEVSRSDGRTILFVSHNMGAVQQLCNKGALIENGIMVAVGDVSDIACKYMARGIDAASYKIKEGIHFVEINNPQEMVDAFPYSAPVLDITFSNTTGVTQENVNVSLALINERGQRVLQINSFELNDGLRIPEGKFRIKVSFDSPIPLSPGFYTVDAHFYSPSRGNMMIAYSVFQFKLGRDKFSEHNFSHLNMVAEPVLLPKFSINLIGEK